MSAEVIQFGKPQTGGWLSGLARCCSCKHEWTAVAPVGSQWLECPACDTNKGLYRNHAVPNADVWNCNCGCDVFIITKTYALCVNCATEQAF